MHDRTRASRARFWLVCLVLISAVFAVLSASTACAVTTTSDLQSVSFADISHGWALGYDDSNYASAIFSTTNGGARWTAQDSGIPVELNALVFADASHGWAVGAGGMILSTRDGGTHWTAQDAGTSSDLNSVAFADASHAWVAGSGGVILATADGGSHWLPQDTNTTNDFQAVAFSDGSHGWALGDSDTIFSTNDAGAHWTSQNPLALSGPLTATAFPDASHGWAVCDDGTILSTSDGGSTWTTQTVAVAGSLFSVAFADVSHGWAVGVSGTILGTADGGAHWVAQTSGTDRDLYSVAFADSRDGWAVGESGTILSTADGGAHWRTQMATLGTATNLTCPPSARLNRTFKLTGAISPAAAPGRVTVAMTHLVGKKWKAAGSARVSVSGGRFTFGFKPTVKGSWRFVATYPGGSVGDVVYTPSKSAIKTVPVGIPAKPGSPRVIASVSDSQPTQGDDVLVDARVLDAKNRPVRNAKVAFVWRFTNSTRSVTARTNSRGYASSTLNIGKATAGVRVTVSVSVKIGKTTLKSSTSFTPQRPGYGPGMYLVGTDIPVGEYVVLADDSTGAYWEIDSDTTGQFSSIIANSFFYNRSIVSVRDGEYIKVESAQLVPEDQVPPADWSSATDGTYRVGYDLPAGEYVVTATSGDGYFEVDSDARGTQSSIVANDNFDTWRYVTVSDGEYFTVDRATISAY